MLPLQFENIEVVVAVENEKLTLYIDHNSGQLDKLVDLKTSRLSCVQFNGLVE